MKAVAANTNPGLAEPAVVLRQIAVAHAAEVARSGDLQAAEDLLRQLLAESGDDIAALDLLARIRAQRGVLSDAESLWREVLRREPEHVSARAGLARIRRLQNRPLWLAPLLLLVAGLSAALCIALAGREFLARQRQLTESLRTEILAAQATKQAETKQLAAALATQMRELQAAVGGLAQAGVQSSNKLEEMAGLWHELSARQQELAARAQALATQQMAFHAQQRDLAGEVQRSASQYRASLRDLEERLAPKPPPPAPPPPGPPEPAWVILARTKFSVPGVVQKPLADGFELRFQPGLFRSGTAWRRDALDRLAGVAARLPSTPPCTVQVAGTAGELQSLVSWLRYRTPRRLAFDRALMVADQLRRLGLPPDARLSVISDPTLISAGPNPEPDSVVLRVVARTSD